MPERWERELAKLRSIEPFEGSIHHRIERRTRPSARPGRNERILAAVVATAVAIGGVAFLVRTLPAERDGIRGVGTLPTLSVSFHDSEVKAEGPDASYREVQTSIVYGDAVDRSFTSTTPQNAIVEWVATEDLTRFVPGPTAGSRVRFEADGDDPRVLLGRPDDWPNFGRMERIDRLPEEPGEYLLVFVAEYPEGIARMARVVDVVEPGVLQVVLTEGGEIFGAEGVAHLDGLSTEGFLSQSSFVAGDVGEQSPRMAPEFGSEAWLEVAIGTPIVLQGAPTTAKGAVVSDPEEFDPRASASDLLAGSATVGEALGRRLLAVDVTWRHPIQDGFTGDDHSQERALLFFPIEVVDRAAEPSPAPPSPSPSLDGTTAPTPTPSAAATDEIVVRIEGLGRSEASRGSPIMRLSFRGETVLGCTQGFTWTTADGTKIDDTSEGSSLPPCSYEPLLVVPPRTPIVVRSEEGTEVFPTRTTTPFFTGSDSVGAYVEWPDGNAEFLAIFEVRSEEPVPKRIELGCAADDRIEFVTPDGPRILPGGSAWIRGNMAGFLRTDVIEQMTRDPGGTTEWDGTWQVVRDGAVVAAVDFSSLGGVACRGYGIGGV